jgi:hypothetical protein
MPDLKFLSFRPLFFCRFGLLLLHYCTGRATGVNKELTGLILRQVW